MPQDEQTIQKPERNRRHHEQDHRGAYFLSRISSQKEKDISKVSVQLDGVNPAAGARQGTQPSCLLASHRHALGRERPMAPKVESRMLDFGLVTLINEATHILRALR
jgi:hypothetical protein